ncbi:type II toxin-antitoxin system VapC family toxin [Geminocystis herdmanii]|uniref:type II toxin-antitoxin system VapC family toxin n=1 Tax=Geminocystis herdmanii TaxID=669359 RepID=UPI00034CEC99|nr:PIN domain-containing protein [Geminocystis herdmanii]
MNVIVDTSVWSLSLRRNKDYQKIFPINNLLENLIIEQKVILLGIIRQEILSGIRYPEQFVKLRDYLRAFSDLEITYQDYELGAEFFNICRQKGIQGSNNDFLICAVSYNYNYHIFTTDKDFDNFKSHIPINLLNY